MSSKSEPDSVAISTADDFLAVGNGSGIYLIGNNGSVLWSRNLNHTISSVSISADGRLIAAGGWQIKGGCAPNLNISGPRSCPGAFYANGEVYLLDSGSGKLLWSVATGDGNPVWKVKISADGTKMAVDTGDRIMYLDGAQGNIIWSYDSGGNVVGMDMSDDGNLIVASMGPIVAFNQRGVTIWSHPALDLAVSVNSVAISSDGLHVWAGSAVNGDHGTLYFFDRQGNLLWQREIQSPALAIQTGRNTTALVSTNFGALLYNGNGSSLESFTGSAPPVKMAPCVLPAFWYGNGDGIPMSFIDAVGATVASYSPGGFTVKATLSPDGRYAAIVANQVSSFSLTFAYLGQPSPSCK
jgi:outer membrane protein assembly factor BamB